MGVGRAEIRLELVRALARFTDARLLPLLMRVKESDPSSEVRTRASEVLRDMQLRLMVTVDDAERGTSAASPDSFKKLIDRLLCAIRLRGASDLHLTVGEPPFVRVNGVLERMPDTAAATASNTEAAIF